MSEPQIEIGAASSDQAAWLISRDTHVPSAWVHRCVAEGEYLTACEQGAPIGLLRYSMFWGVIPFMDLIYVEPDRRLRGVGSALFESWQEAMQERGAAMLMTSSAEDEPRPQAWHQRNGFQRCGTVAFGRHQKAAEVFFRKEL